jgi:cytoskeletal protein CcmA (bactofilin family)
VEALDHKLTIGPSGAVNASVKAREVVVLGTLQGNGAARLVSWQRLPIRPSTTCGA